MADTQKLKFTNTAAGPRGVNGVNGTVLIEAGKSATVEVNEAEFNSAKGTGYFEIGEGADDDQGDGAPGSLKGLNKTQLLEVAGAEGVEIEEGATNAKIVEAIEAKRAA